MLAADVYNLSLKYEYRFVSLGKNFSECGCARRRRSVPGRLT